MDWVVSVQLKCHMHACLNKDEMTGWLTNLNGGIYIRTFAIDIAGIVVSCSTKEAFLVLSPSSAIVSSENFMPIV